MKKENSVEVREVSKSFPIRYTTIYGGTARSGTKQVLDKLSFDVRKGEVMGLVGSNGSGKSTILKIIAGIMYPDSGTFEVRGRIASILELGMGFDPEMTGRDNIRLKCQMFGLTNEEIDRDMDEMIAFSEIGDQIDMPLRTYSSGMTAKVAFAVLTHIRCDVMIIDEALSVGDAGFNVKCKMAFDRMKKDGRTIILASHNLSIIEDMCDRVVWLDQGRARETGNAYTVCGHYYIDLTESPATLKALADSGDVVSQNRLGRIYRDGINVEKDEAKAAEWFGKAVTMGHLDSMVDLADIKMKNGDREGARQLLEKAAVAGNAVAVTRLSLLKEDKDGIAKRFVSSLEKTAESGNLRAKKLLGDVCLAGNLVPRDPARAFALFRECAERGDPASMCSLGLCYRDGNGVQRDLEKADRWLSESARRGFNYARGVLINSYRRGTGFGVDMVKVAEWLGYAANTGDANAMLQLGNMYRDGQGVDKDPKRSGDWLTKFAVQGRLNGENAYGDILKQGNFGRGKSECIPWYEDAAKNGHPVAAFNLAICYRDGIGIPADSSKAAQWFEKSAEGRFSRAMLELANMYLQGNGVPRDEKKGFGYMKQAADMRNWRAVRPLAEMYRDGVGTEKNPEEAKRLFAVCIEIGDATAAAELRSMEKDQ